MRSLGIMPYTRACSVHNQRFFYFCLVCYKRENCHSRSFNSQSGVFGKTRILVGNVTVYLIRFVYCVAGC